MPRDTLSQLAKLTKQLRQALLADLSGSAAQCTWSAHQAVFQQQTGIAGQGKFADMVAQAVACGCFGLEIFRQQLRNTRAIAWLLDGTDPLVRDILCLCSEDHTVEHVSDATRQITGHISRYIDRGRVALLQSQLPPGSSAGDGAIYFYERFLATYDQLARRRKGVFYTPPALVSFVVRSIDELLSEEFPLPHGLADETTWRDIASANDIKQPVGHAWQDMPFVRLLDPAMGTGAFLLAAASVARQRFLTQIVSHGSTPGEENRLWNAYVSRSLLPRLWGQELMLPALVLAQLSMVEWLSESGFQFEHPGEIQFHLANTLQQHRIGSVANRGESAPFTIVLGNPPFSGVSDNRQPWIRALLRGRAPDEARAVADYFLAGGAPLRERKHWLEDDYVKFMRFAHWQIETTRSGIVALVTNHAYLDNSTFRGMREQLLTTFPTINVIDLHGNSRNGERRPDGGPDESVFGIEQGVAVSLLRRPIEQRHRGRLQHTDVWGDRSSKLDTLQHNVVSSLAGNELHPKAPYFFFVPKDLRLLKEYEAGYRLCDVMPVNSTAVVTARDGFVVAFDTVELQQRLRQLADVRIPDEEIRARFFTHTRSQKYLAGDTRGWRLAEARQRLQNEPHWERHIRPCMYRPFDRRQIFWASWMIDWPRSNVMEHLSTEGNLALIARRQMPAFQPCSHFWVSDTITIDGVIRSDNRGGESVFPLYLRERSGIGQRPAGGCSESRRAPFARPNFSEEFTVAFAAKLDLKWSAEGTGEAESKMTPRDLFHYIYALFTCPSYRQRFAEQLCIDFPRVLIPRDRDLFFVMVRLGQALVNAHLLRFAHQHSAPSWSLVCAPPNEFNGVIEPGYPKYADRAIWFNRTAGISPVPRGIWEFRVGTYQVCRKWLKDRRGRVLSKSELELYQLLLCSIDTTIRTMVELDRQVDRHGGWEQAF